jgi:acyl-coenzyme A synthetase/AMP-(fatty) acid ligase
LLGSTPSRALIDAIGRRFSPHMYMPYGLGEVGVVAMANAQTLREDPTWIGVLEPGVKLEVLDDGDVRVFVPGMPADYYGPDAGLGTRFRDGWFHPGDRGRFDANGRFHLEGRTDHLINLGGYKVAPEYVESILMEFPGVGEVAVFAIAGEAGASRLAAAIVPSGPLDWPGLRAHALARLHVMAPARYLQAPRLPRNAMGKLERSTLGSDPTFGTPKA